MTTIGKDAPVHITTTLVIEDRQDLIIVLRAVQNATRPLLAQYEAQVELYGTEHPNRFAREASREDAASVKAALAAIERAITAAYG